MKYPAYAISSICQLPVQLRQHALNILSNLSGSEPIQTLTQQDSPRGHGSKKSGIWECHSQEILPFEGKFGLLEKETHAK